ncbi:MAG TPA: SIMPL domain-containing protein [Candidatus Paceibacterota bacterium]|nr:SIMPL domain-containing protein [Candidatus Paceibacterota bacterium]
MNDTNSMQNIFADRGIRIAVLGVFAILALFLLAQTIMAAENFGRPANPATDTITVTGDGQATMAPDIATVSFTVQNSAAAVADAQSKTTTQANKAIAYVKSQGIADKDIRTLSYDISPQYSYAQPCAPGELCPNYYPGSPKITGYQVSETIQVKVRNLDSVGTILGGLGDQGVQNVNGPDFALDDPTAGNDAARADAIAKAKAQATTLASQLGVHLGKIVNFSESSGGYPYPVMYGAGASADSAKSVAPQVPTGENTYNSSVSITYEIR